MLSCCCWPLLLLFSQGHARNAGIAVQRTSCDRFPLVRPCSHGRGLEDAPLIYEGRREGFVKRNCRDLCEGKLCRLSASVHGGRVEHWQASVLLFCSPCGVSVAGAPPQLLLFFHPGCTFGIGAPEKQIVNKLRLCTDSRRAFTVNTKKCNRAFTEGLNDRTACLFFLF